MSPGKVLDRVEAMLAAVATLAARAYAGTAGSPPRVEASFRPDGALRFAFRLNDVFVTVDWGDARLLPDQKGDSPAVRVAVRNGAGEPARKAREAVFRAATAAAGDPRFRLLHYVNRDLDVFSMDEGGMDRLLARRLAPGRTRCAGFVFDRALEDERDGYALVFSDGEGANAVFRLMPSGVRPDLPRAASPGPFDLAIETALPGEAARPVTGDAPMLADEATPFGRLVVFVRFLLARALHAGMTVDAPPPKPREVETDPNPSPPTAIPSRPAATWDFAPDTSWRRFLCPFEIEHDATGAHYVLDPVIFIEHGELECRHVRISGAGRIRQHKPLWQVWKRRSEKPHDADPYAVHSGWVTFSTYLNEEEIICGASDKLAVLLADLRKDTRPDELIFLNDTCVVRLLGEDLEMVLREHARAGGAPVLTPKKTLGGHSDLQADLMAQIRRLALEREGGAPPSDKEPGTAAFVGYPPEAAFDELAALLDSLGVKAAATLMPWLGLAEAHSLFRAELVVSTPFRGWRKAAGTFTALPGLRVIQPPLPYGLDATRQWFDAILDGLNRPDLKPRVEALHDEAVRELAPLIRQAADCRLGFVMDAEEAAAMADVEGFYGLPALRFLESLGFRLAALVYAGDGTKAEEACAGLAAMLADPDKLSIRPFADKAELAKALAADDIHAVWSQFVFDRRLLACGKASFSLGDLEKGWAGALRTARKLLARCRWPAPRRFGRHVGAQGWPA
ncbi:MAG: hypothetical protein C4523_15950 [Myxococcales bacterium]|nr:MAG: hypothetical protein C4523_15950 [Myxococcales bacterium]